MRDSIGSFSCVRKTSESAGGVQSRGRGPLGRHGSGTLKIFIEKSEERRFSFGSSSIREMAPVMIEERPRERFWEKAGPGVTSKGMWSWPLKHLTGGLKKGRAGGRISRRNNYPKREVQSIRERRSNRSA